MTNENNFKWQIEYSRVEEHPHTNDPRSKITYPIQSSNVYANFKSDDIMVRPSLLNCLLIVVSQ